jgi:hypothetical protein
MIAITGTFVSSDDTMVKNGLRQYRGRAAANVWLSNTIAPIAPNRLDQGQRRDGGSIGPQDARTERNSNHLR